MSTNLSSEPDSLNSAFSALSDPTRRAMLIRLAQGEASVNELAAPFKMSLPAISKHIKVLEKAGLLTKTINAQQRLCKIDVAHLELLSDWISRETTINIAIKAIKTTAISKKNPQKRSVAQKIPQANIQPKIIPNDNHESNDQNDLQQQIGFDF